MLVLTREAKPSKDTIRIGEDITIKILSTSGGSVRIGIEAPRQVAVLRDELVKDDSK